MKEVFGKGLMIGLSITWKKLFEKKITERYPEVKPQLPARSHGSFQFQTENCIACSLCANACPNGVIKVDSGKDENGKKTLQEFKMNLAYCLFCGLCVEACPASALHFDTNFELACYKRKGTVYIWRKHPSIKEEELPDNVPAKTVSK